MRIGTGAHRVAEAVAVQEADPEVWAAALDDYEAQQRRDRVSAEVRAGFLRHAIATCGLPFSSGE